MSDVMASVEWKLSGYRQKVSQVFFCFSIFLDKKYFLHVGHVLRLNIDDPSVLANLNPLIR